MLFGIFSLLLTSGCGDKSSPGGDPAHEHGGHESHDAPAEEGWEVEVSEESDHDHEGHGHDHEAPHGGTLIALGDHFAHLEIIHDATTGAITVYVLDGEAENPVRIEQESIILRFSQYERAMTEGEAAGYTEGFKQLPLEAVANPLTGESVGDTSEFSGTAPFLVDPIARFTATLVKISLLGSDLENIEIEYPEGNE
jgi:hypothetical protein